MTPLALDSTVIKAAVGLGTDRIDLALLLGLGALPRAMPPAASALCHVHRSRASARWAAAPFVLVATHNRAAVGL